MEPGQPPLAHWKPFRLEIVGFTTTSPEAVRKDVFQHLANQKIAGLDTVPELSVQDMDKRQPSAPTERTEAEAACRVRLKQEIRRLGWSIPTEWANGAATSDIERLYALALVVSKASD